MGTVSFLDSIMLIAIISFCKFCFNITLYWWGGYVFNGNNKEIFSLIAAVMLLLGSFIALISAIGIVKFQDVFLRSHAATKVQLYQCY